MTARVHAVAGLTACTLVACFMVATIAAELTGHHGVLVAVRTAIVVALFVLVPSMVVAGVSGRSLAAGRSTPLIRRKQRRTAVAAASGVLVLVPCAVTLQVMAAAGDIGATFAAVQAIELVAGAVNITLLALNARDGRRLTAGARRRAAARAA